MISYAQALSIGNEAASKRNLGHESCLIEKAVGRIAALDVVSNECVPSFNNSAMDGFLVQSKATTLATPERPVTIPVVGSIAAGDVVKDMKADATVVSIACEIMTGAIVPEGPWDAVVKVEDVKVSRDESGKPIKIDVCEPVDSGANIRWKGEDFSEGQPVLMRGDIIISEHVLALASLGVYEVTACRRPKIALISTGNEIVDYRKTELRPGTIRNSTAPYLITAIATTGAECCFYERVGDEPKVFIGTLERALNESPDVILTTGAVSMGKYDFIRGSLESVGAKIGYHKTAIRPGKPILFAHDLLSAPTDSSDPHGRDLGPVLFGIPGNPVSTAVAFRFFVEPYLRVLRGMAPERPITARLQGRTEKPEGLRCFYKASFEVKSGSAYTKALMGQASFMVSPLLEADAWVVLPEQGSVFEEGHVVDVYPLRKEIRGESTA